MFTNSTSKINKETLNAIKDSTLSDSCSYTSYISEFEEAKNEEAFIAEEAKDMEVGISGEAKNLEFEIDEEIKTY
jgi:hypothetical protein